MHRDIRRWLTALSIALVLAAGAGCSSSDFTVGTTLPLKDLTGHYVSTTGAGTLGTLELALALAEDTDYFKAWISSSVSEGLAPSEGIASLGDNHLVINFDRGLLSDYYFEGMLELDGEAVQSITGQFVFPDMTEKLPVVFVPE